MIRATVRSIEFENCRSIEFENYRSYAYPRSKTKRSGFVRTRVNYRAILFAQIMSAPSRDIQEILDNTNPGFVY